MADRPVTFDSTPPSRAAQQQRTREALLEAAFRVFARDGFHGASLDGIARTAGYSKGAVYSNFASKGELFLAVMDHTMTALDDGTWDPSTQLITRDEVEQVGDTAFDDPPTPGQLSRGFGLATLEFASSAGRDDRLTDGLRERLGRLVDAYGRVAAGRRVEGDPLGEGDLAFMLAAFDQGFALFLLIGWPLEDLTLMQRGLHRLLQPTPDDTGASGA